MKTFLVFLMPIAWFFGCAGAILPFSLLAIEIMDMIPRSGRIDSISLLFGAGLFFLLTVLCCVFVTVILGRIYTLLLAEPGEVLQGRLAS